MSARRSKRFMRAMIRGAIVLASLTALSPIARAATLDPATAEADVTRARSDGEDAFCKNPTRPLSKHARTLCPMVSDVKNCQGLVEACEADAKPAKEEPKPDADKPKAWDSIAKMFAAIAQVAVWLLVAAIIVAIAIPVMQAIARARRNREAADPLPTIAPAAAVVDAAPELETVSDAEILLQRAEEHMRRGELDRATITYLNASLRALDQRGAIRIARSRTNGEYVRACKEQAAKRPLRDIVREVDRVQFGGERPTEEATRNVAARAFALVRSLPMMMLCLVVIATLGGCQPRPSKGTLLQNADPAGDELMMDLLKRQGMTVGRLHGSLATLPMPKADDPAPQVIIDLERTQLEDETKAHLAAWVDQGGVLILAGDPSAWPDAFGAKFKVGTSTDVTVAVPDASDEEDDDADPIHFEHAKIARPSAFTGKKGTYELATLKSGEAYAATHTHGKGIILGIANDDLFTNIGLARAGNAAALIALFGVVDRSHDFKVANPEDGISPPTNPVSALHRAGLGLGLWHSLAAALLLFLAVGVRLARPKKEEPPRRRAFAEHVEATGALYARTRIASHALAAYARYADERLRAKMPRGTTDPAAFLASRANADPAHCAQLWARATAARSSDAPRGDDMLVLRQLSALYASAVKSE